jgi:hypothetical protein
MKRRKVKVA